MTGKRLRNSQDHREGSLGMASMKGPTEQLIKLGAGHKRLQGGFL